MNHAGRTTAVLVVVAGCLVMSGEAPARSASWPLLGIYGFWGDLGLGQEVEYHRQGGEITWEGGLSRQLSLFGAGYSLHPLFLSWEGATSLTWGREMDVQHGSLRLDLLPRHPTPTTILVQRIQEEEARDFRPYRRGEADSLEVQSLLGAYGEPVILRWSASRTWLDDPLEPRETLVHTWSANTTRRLNRDNDLTCRYESFIAQDLFTGEQGDWQVAAANWQSRFLYDLVTLDSSWQQVTETGRRTSSLTKAAEELTVQLQPDWKTKLALKGEETRVGDRVNTRAEAGGQTGGQLGSGWTLNLKGRGIRKEGGGVTRDGLDTGVHLGWNGALATWRLAAGTGLSWRPEWGEGAYTYAVFHEPTKLWKAEELAEAKPLANRRVVLDSIRVYRARELSLLAKGEDYDWWTVGEVEGVAEEVYLLWWSGDETRRDVVVDYSYRVPAGDTEQLQRTHSLSVNSTAGNLSLGILASQVETEERSAERGETLRSEYGHTLQLGMLDGPFSVATAMNNRGGVDFRSSTLLYRRPGLTLSQAFERYEAEKWQRRRGVSKCTFDLGGVGVLRLQGFAQHMQGVLTGEQEVRERALQAGIQAKAAPTPNLVTYGSLSYLKDWVQPNRDQVVADWRVEWWRGQLSLALDGELQEDFGRNAARRKLRFLLVRQF